MSSLKRAASSAGSRKRAVAQVAVVGQVGGAGDVAADGIEGPRFRRGKRSAARASMTRAAPLAVFGEHFGGVDDQFGSGVGVEAGRFTGDSTPSLVGSEAAVQAAQPPSSTATASWPSQRIIHHMRAAIEPLPSS